MPKLKATKHAISRGFERKLLERNEIEHDCEEHFARSLPAQHPAERIVVGRLARYPVSADGSILTVF